MVGRTGCAVVAGVLALLSIVGITWNVIDDNTTRSRVVTICSVERTATDSGGEYRVFTSEDETFAMVDSWIGKRRTNTADEYSRLRRAGLPGTFKIEYDHRRWSPLSWLPNLLTFQKIAPDKAAIARCRTAD